LEQFTSFTLAYTKMHLIFPPAITEETLQRILLRYPENQ